MKIARILIASIAGTVFSMIVGMVTCGGLFHWVYTIEPTNVWKAMDTAPGLMFHVGCFILNIIFTVVYALVYKGLPGSGRLVKGVVYGLCVWGVGILPGMFATYNFMTVAPAVIIYWIILECIHLPLKGLLVASVYGD